MKNMKLSSEKKLDKLKMPGKRKEAADVSELDMDLPESEDDPLAEEGPKEDLAMEGDVDLDALDEESPMAGLSDDDLLAEVKKRGLDAKLAAGGEEDELDLGM
jgi:hypothetical protein